MSDWRGRVNENTVGDVEITYVIDDETDAAWDSLAEHGGWVFGADGTLIGRASPAHVTRETTEGIEHVARFEISDDIGIDEVQDRLRGIV